MVKIIPYNPKLKALANKLRKNMTPGEIVLWNELKDDRLCGFDFDRQRCIDNFIVDFYCKELMLAIEIDGQSHNNEFAFINDENRQVILEGLGVRFIRFSEAETLTDMNNVLRTITSTIIEIVKVDLTIKLPNAFDNSLLD